MFRPTCRNSTRLAAVLLASMTPRPAGAQDPFALPGDFLLLKARELEAKHDRARIQDDINRGDVAAMNRDLSLVRRHDRGAERMRRRIRGDVFLPLAFYPYSAPAHPSRQLPR